MYVYTYISYIHICTHDDATILVENQCCLVQEYMGTYTCVNCTLSAYIWVHTTCV